MIDAIRNIDTELFLALNSAHNPFFDDIMYWCSHKFFWIWLYAIFLLLILLKLKQKTVLILALSAIMILCSDQISGIIKKGVKRYRPCHNLVIKDAVFVNGQCGGQFGFVSSHAANSFAIAAFLSLLLYKHYKLLPFLLIDWALLVSYSRIYNGVHYPADIVAGALLGVLIGVVFWRLYIYFDTKFFINQSS